MKWAIISAAGGKTAQQRFDLLNAFLNNKFSLPRGKTVKYADPIPHPTNGQLAIPIIAAAEAWLATAPFTVTLKTVDDLKALGWFPDDRIPGQVGRAIKIVAPPSIRWHGPQIAAPPSPLRWHGLQIAASLVGAAVAGLVYAHYFAHWF